MPATSNRPKQKDRGPRRAEIFAAAAEIFHEKGYDASTTQDIADKVGILKGSLYYYIDTKEDLLFELIVDAHERSMEIVEATREMDGPAIERIRYFLRENARRYAENPAQASISAAELRSLSPERRAVITQQRDVFTHFLRSLIVEGQAEGSVCPDRSPKLLASLILTMAGSLREWFRSEGPIPIDALADELSDFAVTGLSCSHRAHRTRR